MNNRNKIILSFDLDFTLIDNREGIINSFNYTFQKHNIPNMKREELEKTIGTPLFEIFANLSNKNPSILIDTFREFYSSEGIYQVKLLPGSRKKVEELSNSFTLGVITSKKEEMAVKLLKYLKIDHFFDFILGESSGRTSKTDPNLIKYLISLYPQSKFLIVGDHPNDRRLAELLKCPFIGVLTGTHTGEQLKVNSITKTIILESINEITIDKIYRLFRDNNY